MAPAVFCTSPQVSPRAPTDPPASTARKTNCSSTPPVMRGSWATKLSSAARQSTKPMPPKSSTITSAVIPARAVIRATEARNAASTAAPNRAPALASRPNACTVSSPSRVSPA
jgi:hypothetical protein